MGTNIDYIYHPPIDIGVHLPSAPVDTTTSFREHLTGFASSSPNGPTTSEDRTSDLAKLEQAQPQSPHQRARDEQAEGPEQTANDSANEAAETDPEHVVPADASVPQAANAQEDAAAAEPEDNAEGVLLPPTAAGDKASTTTNAASQVEQPSVGTDDLTTAAELPTKELAADSDEDTSDHKKQIAAKSVSAEGTEADETQHAKTLARRAPPLIANEPTNADLSAASASADVAQATPKQGARDKRSVGKNETTSRAADPSNLQPADPSQERSQPLPAGPTKSAVQPVDEGLAESIDAAAKPTSQAAPDKQHSETQPAQGVSSTGKGNIDDRLSTTLSGTRPSESHQSPLTDTQQARLVQRVAKAFDIARVRGESSVRLRLTPPQLGSLQIELKVESGSLTARLEVETQAAREALLDNLHTLRNRLAEQNIRVDQFDVDVSDRRPDEPWGNGGRQDSSQREEDKGTHRSQGKRDELATADSRVTTELLLEEGVIDVII